MRRHFRFALRCQITARTHRQRVGKRTGDSGDDHKVGLDAGADDTGDKSEVGRQTIVEAVDDAAQISAGRKSVPRFTRPADRRGQMLRVFSGLRGDGDRGIVRRLVRRPTGKPQIRADLARFLRNDQRQHRAGSEHARDCCEQTRPHRR